MELKELAQKGTELLEEAVLGVFLDTYSSRFGIGAAEISKRAEIYRDSKPLERMNDAITWGILSKLYGEGRIVKLAQENGKGGFKLSDEELASLTGDYGADTDW